MRLPGLHVTLVGLKPLLWLLALTLAQIACTKGPPAPAASSSPSAATAPPRIDSGAGDPQTASATMFGPLAPQLFARDQPTAAGLIAWNGGAVVRAVPFRFVDADAGVARPLIGPDGRDVIDVATAGPDAVALCAAPRAPLVVQRLRGTAWSAVDNVPAIYADKTPFRLAADGSTIVVWEPARLHVREGAGRWRAVAIPKIDGAPPGVPKSSALAGGRLYLGYASGEWGGGLITIDLATGAARVVQAEDAKGATDDPVTGIATDAKGALWVARGQSHLGLALGSLHRLDGDRFALVASSPGKLGERSRAGWNLDDTSFDALAFDARDRLHLLSGSLGLVRREPSGAFTRLTPSWPSWVYLNGLAFRGEVAIVSTYDSGVLLLDLAKRSAKRVTL